ncbi:MAG: hypothetical protein U9N35_07530, partial [Euryarchaeota archaeon]|nr:hypothetical protein [Euryarchaeota archaeon]
MKTVVLESKKRITVLKVGGSCLTGGESVRKTVEKISQIRKEGVLPALVVSALNGITDSLSEIVISSHKRYNPKDSDRILAEGEQLSVKIIESAVQNAGIEAEGILLSDDSFPILTDDQHGNAEILLEETEKRVEERLKPLIEKGVIPIIPGFVGKTMEGGVTTLGRGGSDTTAVVLGRALGVETVILLKDVPGVLTGDPDIISSPQRISHITAEELVQLGYRGGDVFCPKALRYAPEEMKIRIVDFENGDIMNTGTEIIGNLREKSKMKVMDKKKAAITFIGKNISHIPDLIGKASQELMKNNVPYLSVFSSASSLSFYTEEK